MDVKSSPPMDSTITLSQANDEIWRLSEQVAKGSGGFRVSSWKESHINETILFTDLRVADAGYDQDLS